MQLAITHYLNTRVWCLGDVETVITCIPIEHTLSYQAVPEFISHLPVPTQVLVRVTGLVQKVGY